MTKQDLFVDYMCFRYISDKGDTFLHLTNSCACIGHCVKVFPERLFIEHSLILLFGVGWGVGKGMGTFGERVAYSSVGRIYILGRCEQMGYFVNKK